MGRRTTGQEPLKKLPPRLCHCVDCFYSLAVGSSSWKNDACATLILLSWGNWAWWWWGQIKGELQAWQESPGWLGPRSGVSHPPVQHTASTQDYTAPLGTAATDALPSSP